jgi:hypothetical protein
MAMIDPPSDNTARVVVGFLAAEAMMDVDDHKMSGRGPETIERRGERHAVGTTAGRHRDRHVFPSVARPSGE